MAPVVTEAEPICNQTEKLDSKRAFEISAGESVQQRRIVGEHTERVALSPRLTKRLSVAIETTERASRVRVLLEFDDR